VKPLLMFSNSITYKVIDRGLIELIGPTGITQTLSNVTKNISNLQSGVIYNYAFVIFISATGLIILLNQINELSFDIILILPLFAYLLFNKKIK